MTDHQGIARLTETLAAARQEKRLTQRALSERMGIPQSHLSKIESGAVDVRISSLIDLARALDLEVMLVPQRLLPAVQAITRSHEGARSYTEHVRDRLTALIKEIDRQARVFANPPVGGLLDVLRDLSRLRFNEERAKQIEGILSRIEAPRSMKWSSVDAVLPVSEREKWLNEANAATDSLRRIRNEVAHGSDAFPARALPAYRLSDGDDDG